MFDMGYKTYLHIWKSHGDRRKILKEQINVRCGMDRVGSTDNGINISHSFVHAEGIFKSDL